MNWPTTWTSTPTATGRPTRATITGTTVWVGSRCWTIPEGVTFDGNGYTIHNLFINGSGVGSGVALFTGNSGSIVNLNLKTVQVQGVMGAAALAYRNDGVVNKCSATGDVSIHALADPRGDNDGPVGGLVGGIGEDGDRYQQHV